MVSLTHDVWFRWFKGKLSRMNERTPFTRNCSREFRSNLSETDPWQRDGIGVWKSVPRGLPPEFSHQLAKEIRRLRAKRLGDRDELGYVHLALVALDHTDDRVRALEERGEIALREATALADAGDDRGEGAGGGTSEGFQGSALRLAERHTDNG